MHVENRRSPHKQRGARPILVVGLALMAGSAPVGAIPVDARALVNAEFFASNDLLRRQRDWYYAGTLDTFNRPWSDEHVFTGGFGNELGRASVTGERVAQTANTSYDLHFRGEFEDVADITGFNNSWNGNLVSHNAHRDDGEVIPPTWKSGDGYRTPSDVNAAFDRSYSLVKQSFAVGEFNCPAKVPGTLMDTAHCEFREAWFAGSADLRATLQGEADISAFLLGQESINVTTRANRRTRFKVNEATLAILADIQNPETQFQLDDSGQLKEVNLSWTATLSNKTKVLETRGDTKWEGAAEHARLDASYDILADMEKYISAGNARNYLVEILDSPNLLGGISGNAFTSALVFASLGASNVEELHKLVAYAIPVPEPSGSALFMLMIAMLTRIPIRSRTCVAVVPPLPNRSMRLPHRSPCGSWTLTDFLTAAGSKV